MNNSIFIKKSLKTVIEMLIDRKILPDNYSYNYDGFIELIEDNNKSYHIIEIESDICILYYMNEKYKVNDFKSIIKDFEKQYNLLFLILKENLTENNKKTIPEILLDITKEYQIFNIKDLQINITKHSLQPKFEIITNPDDIKEVYNQYNLIIDDKIKQLFPYILKTDPISKYYGLKPGNLLKIIKNSESSGEYITYRLCV